MYTLGGVFTGVDVAPGTNLLIEGPPMTGKYALAMDVLAAGLERGEGAIVVSTKDNAERVTAELAEHAPDHTAPVGVVDAVTQQQGAAAVDTEFVRYVSSPVDLTGMGIELSELLREFYTARGVTANRILLHSLSTLLMYSDLQTVFRFLHVFTGRVQSADALGLFVIDDSAHDAQTTSTVKQLFDGIVEVEDGGDGQRARLVGIGDEREWRPL